MTRLLVLLAGLVLLAAAGAGAAAGEVEPPFSSWAYWQEDGDGGTSRSEVARNFLLALIALGALIVGSIRALSAHRQARAANEQARIAEQGQFTERFSRAAEQLGNPALPVRLGGIYALWRLAEDSSVRDLKSVIDILCAFVRDPPHPDPLRETPDPDGSVADAVVELLAETPPGPDVQAILDLIGARDAPYRARLPGGHRLDLSGANLTQAQLRGADLTGANLTRADLTNADLTNADLMRANITRTDLTGANLADANLWVADSLTQDQLDSACISKGGTPPGLPEGLKPPRKVCEPRTR
jgi:hypothetical protein